MVSLTGLGASHYSYGPSMLFALVPSVVSALFRSTFESKCAHLTTNKRQFAYFLLSSFIPTVFALRWHALAWKASLAVSAVLTIAAKYFSDQARSVENSSKKHENINKQPLDIGENTHSNSLASTASNPPPTQAKLENINKQPLDIGENTHSNSLAPTASNPPPTQAKLENIEEPPLDIVKFTHSNSLTPTTSNLLLAQAESLPVETLLKALIPGNYQVTIKGDVISISEKKIENEFKFWANKALEQDLTQRDVDKLRGRVRYRDLDDNQRNEIRKSLYQSLFPLINETPINLPFMTGYSGEAVTLKRENSQLVINFLKNNSFSNEHCKILISENGNTCFNHYNHNYLVNSVNTQTQEVKSDNTVKALNKKRAYLELLNFKLDEVVAFLKNGNAGQAKKAFQGCCDVLSSFQKELNQLTENPTSTSLVKLEETIEKSSYSRGPMWSPVAASEDSFFTWHITTDKKTDEVSFRLEKYSGGRGMMGGIAEREVTVTKGKASNLLTIEIFKSKTNDLEHHDSNSKYSIEDKGEKGIFVTPLGREVNESCLPFILGMSFYQKNVEKIQLPEQIQTDMGFITKVLSTLNDIQSSPDTLIFDENHSFICDLRGDPVPTERIKQLSNYRQEGVGHPLVSYHDRRIEGRRVHWNGITVLNSPTAKETNPLNG